MIKEKIEHAGVYQDRENAIKTPSMKVTSLMPANDYYVDHCQAVQEINTILFHLLSELLLTGHDLHLMREM